jgi:hypothetical protein
VSLRAVVLPPVPALLPEYAGRTDPVPELRAACREAVGWLVEERPDTVALVHDPVAPADAARGVTTPLGERVGRELLREASYEGAVGVGARGATHVLVLANGSARRGESAPGHLDERAFAFDDTVRAAVTSGDPGLLAGLDVSLGADLLAAGIAGLQELSQHVGDGCSTRLLHESEPFGVQYWVTTWASG